MKVLTHTVFSTVEYVMMGSDRLILPGHIYVIIIKKLFALKAKKLLYGMQCLAHGTYF